MAFGFDPLFPLLQVVAFALLAIALAAWLYQRATSGERRSPRQIGALTAIRLLVVAALALLLLNPSLTRAEKESGKPPLLVLLDTSHSMAVPDVGGKRRYDVARQALLENDELRQEYQKHYTPIFFSMAERVIRQEFTAFRRTARPDGGRTNLGEAIAGAISAAAGAPSGGVLLVSDGRGNGEINPVEVAKAAKARQFPVFTVCLGTTARRQDLSLVSKRPQVYAAPGQEVSLTADLRSIGYHGQAAQVQLLKDGRPLSSKTVPLQDSRPVPVTFSVSEAKEGSYRYAMAVRPMPREGTDSNNRSTVLFHVLDSKIRVLVLEGRPTWDAKFLIQALHTDPSIELDAIFKLTEEKFFAVKGTADPAALPVRQVKVPSTPAELAKYDVIIIGKGFEEFFTSASGAGLKRYVADHAGSIIFLRGKPAERATSLQALEPVHWSEDQIRDFRMQLTDEGARNPAFSFRAGPDPQTVIQKLPTMISATRVEGEKALTVVLARASGIPSSPSTGGGAGDATSPPALGGAGGAKEMAVLAYQNYGQGKVVALVGQGLWRWAFLPPELKEYASCYSDFWTQLIRWLVSQSDFLPGQDVSLKSERTTYSPGETVNFLAYDRGTGTTRLPPLRITGPDGRVFPIRLGKVGGKQADFIGSFKPKLPGEYLAHLSSSSPPSPRRGGAGGGVRPGSDVLVPFTVFHTREEDIITAADPELMRQIAQASGGETLSIQELDELPQKLKVAHALLTIRTEPRPAWDRWWVLASLLGALSLEWLLRRRMGLL
jgi:hypothetical protein